MKILIVGSSSRYKLPSIVEVAVAGLFLVAWLFPVIATWGVAASGRKFSFTAPHWQNQYVDIVAVSIIATVGLFKPFGGTIFEKGYVGPSVVWLGYGAWSVTFLLSVNLLIGDFLSKAPP